PLWIFFLPTNIWDAAMHDLVIQGLYQALGPSIIAVVCFNIAITRLDGTVTAAFVAFVPAMAALLAIPILGEWPTIIAWFGIASVTIGMILSAFNPKRSEIEA
ncbi:MAG: EamA family transporter, partial [Pseudomonadota bacterium]